MSRIHEALKKAALERTKQLTAEQQPSLVEVDFGHRGPIPATNAEREPAVLTPAPLDPSRMVSFEDLAKYCARQSWKNYPRFDVVPTGENGRIVSERFGRLRSRLYQIAAAKPLRTIVVTSSVPEEGKSFVASNLVQSIVRQPEKRALLIDADLRSPRIHEMLGTSSTPGLTDYLRGEADEFRVIQQGGGDNSFFFIPCGRAVSNPSELLVSERMKKLLKVVSSTFDWVILDSPPTLPVHDASALADVCDGVLFVVRAGRTNFDVVEAGVADFRTKNLLGVVLNRVEQGEGYEDYYGYPVKEERE
jgi:protein-tyrosine kinase